jgi:hypothetical protein
VADDTIHLIVRDESADVFTVRSLALYLADGTLFALYGQADVLLEKSAQALMLLAIDIRFEDVDASAITFGDTNFLNPPATPNGRAWSNWRPWPRHRPGSTPCAPSRRRPRARPSSGGCWRRTARARASTRICSMASRALRYSRPPRSRLCPWGPTARHGRRKSGWSARLDNWDGQQAIA